MAAKAIYAVLESGKSLQEVLPASLDQLKEKDKAWLHEMLYGVLRNLPTLQLWLRKLLNNAIKADSRVVEHLLYLGLYQLHFSRVSDHAAVSETVAACEVLKQKHLKNLVNAVLRNFQRQDIALQHIEEERIRLNLPKWYFKKLSTAYPDTYIDIARKQSEKPAIWLRINQQKITRSEYGKLLEAQNISHSTNHLPESAVMLQQSVRIDQLPGFEEGYFSVQDKAAQHAAFYLTPEAQDKLLDACAAPGGKYLHLLEQQPDIARAIALEIDKNRLDTITENAKRLDINNIELCSGDATAPQVWNKEGLSFSKILLDAPCSATGIIRRHPDILWLRKAKDIEQLVHLQSAILDALWQVLEPGGTLLYATCSILPEENREQIKQFLSRTEDARHVPLMADDTPENPGRQILPGEEHMDGFYYAKLKKA